MGLKIVSKLSVAIASCTLLAACAAPGGENDSVREAPYVRPATATPWGLLPNGERSKFHWPFASTSLWNAAIGKSAIYQTAGVVSTKTFFVVDPAILIMTPKAPLTTLYFNGAGWTGADRCQPSATVLATNLPIPANFIVPNSGSNNSTAILVADGIHFDQNQPFTRCRAGAGATALGDSGLDDIYGNGISVPGAHGGSGLSALGGVIRYGEFTSGKIHHPMQIELWAHRYYYCCAPIWPATQVDGYAKTVYGGTLPYLAPGSLMALLPSFNRSSLKTVPGKILAKAFEDYGAYVVDDTYGNAWSLTVESGPKGNTADEFRALYGYDLNQNFSHTSKFYKDLVTIYQALQVVTSNSATTIGGGGRPRVPAPPPIGD